MNGNYNHEYNNEPFINRWFSKIVGISFFLSFIVGFFIYFFLINTPSLYNIFFPNYNSRITKDASHLENVSIDYANGNKYYIFI